MRNIIFKYKQRILASVLLCIVALFAFGQNAVETPTIQNPDIETSDTDNTNIATKNASIEYMVQDNYTRISSKHDFTIILINSDSNAIIIEGPTDLIDRVKIRMEGNILYLAMKFSLFVNGSDQVTISVPVQNLEGIYQLGDGIISSMGEQLKVDMLEINARGSSQVQLALRAKLITIDGSKNSDITIEGITEKVIVSAKGTSKINLKSLFAYDVEVYANGLSKIELYSSATLDVKAFGKSSVEYIADGLVRLEHSEAGNVVNLEE